MDIESYVEQHYSELVELIKTLCRIPAPSNDEGRRAAFCRDWLIAHGLADAHIDSALNAVCSLGDDGRRDVVILMAHTDTVFPDPEPFEPALRYGCLYCPGVGDDTANLAALLLTAAFCRQSGEPDEVALVFAANAGEEGLGNLKGSRRLLDAYGSRVREVISFDGAMGHILNRAVGSRRYRVTARTRGGHSFSDFGAESALRVLSELVCELYRLEPPCGGDTKTTYNVGLMEGGTAVNAIPQQASLTCEYRSDSAACLAEMERRFTELIEARRSPEVKLTVELLGERPCTGEVDATRQQALEARLAGSVRRAIGRPPLFGAGSTDCNIPLSRGIPAVCTGLCEDVGPHTREEYITLASLRPGLRLALDFVSAYLKA